VVVVFLSLALMASIMYGFFSTSKVAQEKSRIVLLDPATGKPQLLKSYKDQPSRIEIEAFITEAMSKIFTINFGQILDKKGIQEYISNIRPFFDDKYLKTFLQGLKKSRFFEALVKKRATIFTTVILPVEIVPQKDGKLLLIVKTRRHEQTAKGSVYRDIVYRVIIRKGPRSVKNPWGFKILFIQEAQIQSPVVY